jgi:hypothetical protein
MRRSKNEFRDLLPFAPAKADFVFDAELQAYRERP